MTSFSKISLVLVLLSLISCADRRTSYRGSTQGARLADSREYKPGPTEARRFPWELWSYGRDLKGERISSITVVRADESLRSGDRVGALTQYEQSLKEGLSFDEKEAVVFRIAGCQLAFDHPEQVLITLSGYFRGIGTGVDRVPPKFSLLFAYAYGRKGDYDQALAWFVRTTEVSGQGDSLKESAKYAAERMIRTATDERFEVLAAAWSGDMFVRELMGTERSRRASNSVSTLAIGKRPFFEDFEGGNSSASLPLPPVDMGNGPKLGVLLPLSGQFADLGMGIKNGLELSLAGARALDGFTAELVVKDSLGLPSEAVTQAKQLFLQDRVRAVVGPLLAEEAVAVSSLAVQSGIPMVSFSKRSDFRTGDYIFRLAPTAEAQIQSLVEACAGDLGMRKFAIVYPDDDSGREFASVFKRQLQSRGLSIVYESSFPKDNADALIERAKELEKVSVEGVFFPDSLTVASRFFSSVAESARKRMRPLGLANWDSAQEILHSATVLNGAVFVSPFFRESSRPVVSQFIKLYRDKYGVDPDFLAAQGFDAGTMILAALRRERNEGNSLASSIRAIDTYQGLTGKIHVDSKGEFARRFSVVQLQDGVLTELLSLVDPPKPSF